MSSPFFYISGAPWMEKAKVLPSTVDGCHDDIAQSKNIVVRKPSWIPGLDRKNLPTSASASPGNPAIIRRSL
ncbi:hypothetical protein [Pseudomonas thivervalensis]|uniref:hypothetical protein n=1 Tax=Pseudomonas thivervalensis TaxID=86265 RepID=UPI00155D89FA|nr:hypothetical protein [Pseudomonas thivervalensis]